MKRERNKRKGKVQIGKREKTREVDKEKHGERQGREKERE